jgi:hypothetical protein
MSLTETQCIDKSWRMTESKTEAMPRWVKLFAILFAVAAVAFAVLHLTGHAPHGH